MTLQSFNAFWLPQIENVMRERLAGDRPEMQPLYGMLRYHMGWEDQAGRPEVAAAGKRVRPLVALMACQAAGGDPARALPAAAAVELVHNFSLIHDDIEDNSPTRRGRPTLWTFVGVPQAINAGDILFTLARLALLGLTDVGVSAGQTLRALCVFDQTCVWLTEGQYLDMRFEQEPQVTVATYLTMIAGKTAALLAASAQLGAIVAGAEDAIAAQYWRFGHELGLSFQIQDDILGIWGDEAMTGKSASSDILTRKKTLPVLYALAQTGPNADALRASYALPRDLTPADLPGIISLLERLGARAHAAALAEAHARAALEALAATGGEPAGAALLHELALALLGRSS